MCFDNPTKSLEIAIERVPLSQWMEFEREFSDFCTVNGLADGSDPENGIKDEVYAWAKWAYWSARPRQIELTGWIPCTLPPVRDGWYDVQRGMRSIEVGFNRQLLGPVERVRFKDGAWDRESCESKIGVWVSWDCWRGVTNPQEA